MDRSMNVCVVVGSLRKASFNGMLANALISLAPSSMKLETVEIGQLPFYNQDLEIEPPPAQWTAFRRRIKAADAMLFVTPEYNRSVPAVLKNALDVGSRPYGSSVWDRKPCRDWVLPVGRADRCRATRYRAAHHQARQRLLAHALYASSQGHFATANELVEAHGGGGYTTQRDIERHYRDCRINIAFGNSKGFRLNMGRRTALAKRCDVAGD